MPNVQPLAGSNVRNGQHQHGTQEPVAVADSYHPDSHRFGDTHLTTAVGAHTSPQATEPTEPKRLPPAGTMLNSGETTP